jgi:subtilase family protein
MAELLPTPPAWPRCLHKGLLAATAAALAVALAPAIAPPPSAASHDVSVIVRELPGAGDSPERLVHELGGRVERHIRIIRGFIAEVPAARLDALRSSSSIYSVTRNARIELHQVSSSYDPSNDLGSLYNVNRQIQAPEMWKKGWTGRGVGIALIDSGVVPVNGLSTPGKIVNGLDISFESQAENLRYLDSFGHGTHMAGIIAGRDSAAVAGSYDKKEYAVGVAPEAHIVNVKVADYEGATDVSQVLAAIDWVVEHRNDSGLNIRVLNLSFGTDGTQGYGVDPLAHAAEVAWRKGIVVVVAAGNSGFGTPKLNNPAYDPYVIAVGATQANATPDAKDDLVPAWSSRGDGTRNPDLVAPGTSIASLRAPGSYIDGLNPQAVVYDRFFKGSGTSQSAAVVSGAAALIVHQRPSATPDQVKKLLMSYADRMPNADAVAQGAGVVNLKKVVDAKTPPAAQAFVPSTGLGSIDAARGTARLYDDGLPISGEQDIFGTPWNAPLWAAASTAGTSWNLGLWNGKSWSGDCWCATTWAGKSWSGKSWSGMSWSGKSWSSIMFSGKSWSGKSWSSGSWSGKSWSGKSWSGNAWSTARWGP